MSGDLGPVCRMSGALGRSSTFMPGPKSLVLCYHRVAEGVDDPFQLCAAPERFAAHLEEISRYGEPSTLDELSQPSRRPRVVVTLDDGYVDNLTNALPIAEAKGVPITVFVTSGQIGRMEGFWWDRMAALLQKRPAHVRDASLRTATSTVRVELGVSLKADLRAVRRELLPLPVAEIHGVLDALAQEWDVTAAVAPDARAMTSKELVELASSTTVTIGAHTVDHVRLKGMPAEEQLRTVASSRQQLEEICGRTVGHFAYPYGGTEEFDDVSVQAARLAGFETACTTIPGNAAAMADPFRIPRRIVMNWSRNRFRVSLLRWRLVPRH